MRSLPRLPALAVTLVSLRLSFRAPVSAALSRTVASNALLPG
jgi:hypothetical protein